MKKIDKNTNIIGSWNGTIEDLVRPFLTGGDIIRARKLAPMYIKYCEKFKIKADIAFAQMCHETGKLTFKGIAKPEWNNFAGLGITSAGAKQTFADEDLGVIAHIAHLAWYVYPDHVHSLCSIKFDPRHFGTTHYKYNGDSTLKRLNNSWAVPGKTYADRIADYANIINNVSVSSEVSTVVEIVKPLLQKGDKGTEVKKLQKFLSSVGIWLKVDGDFGPKTEAGVKAYQKSKGLEETGFVDEGLKKLMNDFVVAEPEKLDLLLQLGHIGRKTGYIGAEGEQKFTQALGDAMEPLLKGSGLKYRIMGADNWLKPEPNKAKIFLALHYDGSVKKTANGYSMGYKPYSDQAFKEMLAVSYGKLCGFRRRKDNYTKNLRRYYGWTTNEKRKYQHTDCDFYALIEHGFGSNLVERKWMFDNINEIAVHHVGVIKRFLNEQKT